MTKVFTTRLGASAKDRRKMDRMIHLALTAAKEALEDADFVADSEAKAERAGVMVGSGIGGMIELTSLPSFCTKRARGMSPFMVPSTIINMASGHISIRNNLKGPNHACVTACATGTHAVGGRGAHDCSGRCDLYGGGAVQSLAVCRLGMGGFAAARALSSGYNDQPEQASRPWDKGRDGFVMGDGAGMLIWSRLSTLRHAAPASTKSSAMVCLLTHTT